jgi:hypothetical protein
MLSPKGIATTISKNLSMTQEERRQAREMAFHVGWVSDPSTAHRRGPAKAAVCDALARRGWEAATGTARRTIDIGSLESYLFLGEHWSADYTAKRQVQAKFLTGLLRCLEGNPFHPVNINPSWLEFSDSAVLRLAQSIYDNLAFDRLPILADVLTESGCNDTHLLNHCRQPGSHYRGCWVVDAILGKS